VAETGHQNEGAMNTYLKTSLKWFAAAAIAASIGLSQGCAPNGSVLLVCRHEAVACALAMAEKHGGLNNVGIAVGPSLGANHAQSYVIDGNKTIRWVESNKTHCYIGEREGFSPEQYVTVHEFMATKQWWNGL